jgi:hypothetical protein
MKREQTFILWAAGASSVAIVPWLYVFWSPTFSRRASDWADFGTFVGGVLSPTLAFAALIGLMVTIGQQRSAAEAQKSVTDNESYFKHAVSSLERAFNLLSSGEPHQPVHDRLAWLSCARLLLSAKAASMKITNASAGLLILYAGEEEHWRHQFYLLLRPLSPEGVGARRRYFEADSSSLRTPIEERSIRVIYDFASWPEGRQDPIDDVPRYTREELAEMRVGMAGIREFVLSSPRFRGEVGQVGRTDD